MTEVVDMLVKPILMMPPIFSFPPITTAICGLVELIKGGEIENIPGIGILLKYARESILILVLLIILYVKSWQYIGPKLWHLMESGKTYLDEPKPGDYGMSKIPQFIGAYILWKGSVVLNWLITVFLQIPIDIMSWDMESLSLDFGNLWNSDDDFFREDCRRFVNGSYAGDYSLYEKETSAAYTGSTYTGSFNDKYEHSPNKYLCTHGNYCPEMSDVFGRTMMGKNASLTKDKSPTNGYVNGINITSAPRKYAVCCDSIKGSGLYQDCPKLCHGRYPMPNLGNGNPFSDLSWDDLKEIASHPINFIEEPIKAIVDFPDDFKAAKCLMHNALHDVWAKICSGRFNPIPCPESNEWPGYFKFSRKEEGPYRGCSKDLHTIISDIGRNIDILKSKCEENCQKENDAFLMTRGCNSSDMEKAQRSALRNRNDVLLSQLPTDYEDNKIKDMAIKRTPWKLGEIPNELNPNTEYNRGQQVKISASLTMENGTDCSRHDLSELESDNCFGPFKPMTPEQYPVLFYKITKDFMGTMLWALLGIFVFFIMLYILCLFNPIGRAAYKLNENAGMIEGGMESTGMNMDNIVKMIK